MGVLRRFKSMKDIFSKSNTQQNTSAPRLGPIADDDEFEEYDPAAFDVKSPAPEASPEESSGDQFVPGAWRSPRPSVRLAKSSGHRVPGQGRAVRLSRSPKRPDSGQWEVYDPTAFETKPVEIPGDIKTPHDRLRSPKPSKAIHSVPSPKVSSHGRNTKLVMAESAEAVRRARSSPRNDFVEYGEITLSIDDSTSSTDTSPRRLAGATPPALQNPSRVSPRRLASPKTKNLSTAEPPAKNVQPLRGANQSNWPLEDSSTQLAMGQGGSEGWAAFDAAYKAKFGEAIPPSGTAAVARKLGSPQILSGQGPKGRSSDLTVEALTATLTLHSSGNTTLSNRLASPQPPMVPTLGNRSQHLPLEADQPLKEWPFRDLRVGKAPAGDKVDLNFRPKAEPPPGALKEWPFKGFKVANITDRDRSGIGREQFGSGAVLSPQSSSPPAVDQSTIYAESIIDASQEEDKDCMICAESLPKLAFPSPTIAPSCTHEVSTCLSCLARSIRHDLENRMWDKIQCPECRALLDHYSIRKYADEETFARYESLSLRAVMANSPDFAWCRGPGCPGGQIHAGGAEQPIMTCVLCNFRTCFFHQVAWHDRLTCEEYDAMQQDPEGFQSAIEKEEAALAAQEAARLAQEQQDMELARNLEAQDLAAQEEARLTRERRNAELVRRRAEEMAARELQEREDEEMARALERDSEIAEQNRVRELEEKAAERRRQVEEEQRRREAAEAKRIRQEAEKSRLAQEAEAKRQKEAEAKRQRKAAEAEAKRKLEEAKRKLEEAKKKAEVKRKREEEAASLKMINSTTKKCPGYNCGRPIEKNDGCAHMTCIKCRHEFCWDCLEDYKEIRKAGNDKHAPTCRFHTNNILD